jgi:hypothetical protein
MVPSAPGQANSVKRSLGRPACVPTAGDDARQEPNGLTTVHPENAADVAFLVSHLR